MARFTKKIVGMMKAEGLFETQGGPIILSQVNELIIQLVLYSPLGVFGNGRILF